MDRDTKLNEALSTAEDCFWESVAKSYPEIKTGDLDPGAHFAFRDATRNAVTAWLDLNAPKPPQVARVECDMVVEMRPPQYGERGWRVLATTAEAALAEVLRESEELGWVADSNHKDVIDENGMRLVTISFKTRAIDRAVAASPLPAGVKPMAEHPMFKRTQAVEPRTVKMRELEVQIEALPVYNGWIFDVMGHTGSWGYVHPGSEVTVFCTPDWETRGYLAISCEHDSGKPLPSDLCGPVHDEGLEFDVMTDTAEQFIALVKPWLDKHQPKCSECGRTF